MNLRNRIYCTPVRAGQGDQVYQLPNNRKKLKFEHEKYTEENDSLDDHEQMLYE